MLLDWTERLVAILLAYNFNLQYRYISQCAPSGVIFQNIPKYTLEIQAVDLEGNGLTSFGKSIITVADSNDIAPEFEKSSVSVQSANRTAH